MAATASGDGLRERLLRVVAGVLLAAGGAFALPARVEGAVGGALWVLLVVTVVDLVVSGAIGYCPVHRFIPAVWTGEVCVPRRPTRRAAVGASLVGLLAAVGLVVLVLVMTCSANLG